MRAVIVIGVLCLAGCSTAEKTTVESAAAAGPDCRPWKSSALVQCWWPGAGRPLAECEVQRPAQCSFDEQAVTVLNGDRGLTLDSERHPNGAWVGIEVYRDEQGQIGRASFYGERGRILPKEVD